MSHRKRLLIVYLMLVCHGPAWALDQTGPLDHQSQHPPDAHTVDAQISVLEDGEYPGGINEYRAKIRSLVPLIDPTNLLQTLRLNTLLCFYPDDATEADLNLAILHANQWLEQATLAGSAQHQADILSCRAAIRQWQGKYDDANSDLAAALAIAENIENMRLMADIRSGRGDLLALRGDLALALEDLQFAYGVYQAQGKTVWATYVLSSIANTYRRMGDFEHANVLLSEVASTYESRADLASLMSTRYLQAIIYDEMQAWPASYDIINILVDYYRKTGSLAGELNSLLELAYNRLGVGDIDAAKQALEQSERLIDKGYDPVTWALWHYYQAQADFDEQHYEAALAQVNLAEPEIIRQENYRYLAWVQALKAKVLRQLAQPEPAYQALVSYQRTLAILSEKRKDLESVRRLVGFNAARQEHENQVLRAQQLAEQARIETMQERRNWQMVTLALVIFLLVFLMVWAVKQWRHLVFLRSVALTDELTQLANRRSIYTSGKQDLRHSINHQKSFCLLVLDLDYFKKINDTWGHDVGDKVLAKVAEISQAALRKDDRMGRTGGEEFLVTLPCTRADQAMGVALRIRRHIQKADFSGVAEGLKVTSSIGVAELKNTLETFNELVCRADSALYAAKDAGRNCVELAA